MRQYPRTLRCYDIVHNELIKRNRLDLENMLVSVVVPMMYIDTLSPVWQRASDDIKRQANKAIVKSLKWSYEPFKMLPIEQQEAGFKTEILVKHVPADKLSSNGIQQWAEKMLSKDIKKDILIIGQGIVGTNLANELNRLNPDVYDKYKGADDRNLNSYHVAFICVDTPHTDSNPCDISEVRNAIVENDADIYVIKSTVLPGTVDTLRAETGKRIVFSPEYYGATQHCNNFEFNFTILGGEKEDCLEVIQLLQRNYDGRHSFRITDARTAELAKYMENCWLATKVSFCNQFFDIANAANVNYEELRELFILDPRVNPSHTFVYNDHPYWKSHCLDKDVRAVAETYDAPLLKDIIRFNEKRVGENNDCN